MSDNNRLTPDAEYGIEDVELYDSERCYTAVELCRVCRLSHERFVEYVSHNVLPRPDASSHADNVRPDERFTHVQFLRLARAVRVRRELEVELPNLALVVDLLERLEEQGRELEHLRSQLGGRLQR